MPRRVLGFPDIPNIPDMPGMPAPNNPENPENSGQFVMFVVEAVDPFHDGIASPGRDPRRAKRAGIYKLT